MHDQLRARQVFKTRVNVLYGVMAAILLVLLGQLINLQWIQHDKYALQADRNRINVVPVLPVRGEILDRYGRGLAVNTIAYQVMMIPERVENMDATLGTLSAILGWSDSKELSIRDRIQRSRADRPVLLDDKLKWKQVAPLASRLHHLPGVDVQAGTFRWYPYGPLTSHLIGYLSLANQEDLDAGYLPTEFVGRTGVERSFETTLHGSLGSQQEEVDAHGHRIAVLKRSPPTLGEKLQLTLDIDIQKAASDALGNRTGAVVVLDVNTGGVIAMISKPGYDTNQFITGLESEQWQTWLQDPRKPLLNRSTQAAYPPASTFKLVSALAGLRYDEPLATGHTFCHGFIQLADRNLRCWKREGHQEINLHNAIVESCDVYFYELGDQLGMEKLSEEAHRWGFGERTGINLPPESRGNIPNATPMVADNRRDSAALRRQQWFRGETMITAIGQGSITATPLQVARFAAALANGGELLRPALEADQPPVIERTIDVDPAQLQTVRNAMRDVVADPHGTAFWPMRHVPWTVAGKTGTAQVIAMAQDDQQPSTPEYDRHKDHAWFMGFAPFENPQIAFAVFVEHGGHGGSAAGPIAAKVLETLASKETIAPPAPGPDSAKARKAATAGKGGA
ncbi:MAG TPA: penicillin-binding protein 2 [Mariprofundaceae bacterium]|nr:penicillin-binding protein 2 [Mariprofundaceae bacterium]